MTTELDPRRKGRITGSRIAAVLGVSPYATRADVLREMVREYYGAPREFLGNDATRYGIEHERDAIEQYEMAECVLTHGAQRLAIHPVHDWLAVTPDGLVDDRGMIEVKCPYRGTYTNLDGAPHYRPQVQLQLAVTGRDWCDFVVLQRDGRLHVSREMRADGWLAHHLPALEAFMADFRAACDAPEQYLADRDRTDDAWRAAAAEWAAANAALKYAEGVAAKARDALLALAGDASARGCGVQVIRAERAGSVAYAKALKALAPDADLSEWTAPASVVFSVKAIG